MSDENPKDEKEEEMKNKEEELRGEFEEAQEETLQVRREADSSVTPSLVSDFCHEEAESKEEEGEGYWVCQEIKGEGEAYEEYEYPTGLEEAEVEEEEMLDLTAEERRTLDSEYLKSVLGTPLTFALLDIATKRPTDPIQYLGSYLLKWKLTNNEKEEYERQMKKLNLERETFREKMRERERQLMLEKEEKEEEYRRGERDESTVEDDKENAGEGHELGVEG